MLILWKKENEALVSLVISYMLQHCTMVRVHTCAVKVYDIATSSIHTLVRILSRVSKHSYRMNNQRTNYEAEDRFAIRQ